VPVRRVRRHRGGAPRAAAQAVGGELQAVAFGRLEHVVDHALLEGLDRVLVVGGDEHDLGQQLVVVPFAGWQLGDLACRVDAGQARHADVQEHDVGPVLLDQGHRLEPVLRLGHDVQVGPDLEQPGAQLLAHQSLVVGQHRARAGWGGGVVHRGVLGSHLHQPQAASAPRLR
jgi:hypothetical protein